MWAEEFLGGLVLPLPILLLRLVGAAALCALIGYEREASNHAAGLRTNMLVGLAASAYALITLHLVALYDDYGEAIRMDPVRLVEAVTAGVAFLAAGMIVLTRGRVRNLTTGAMMWLSAAIGLAAGSGLWPMRSSRRAPRTRDRRPQRLAARRQGANSSMPPGRDQDFETCSGLPLRLVEASSSSCSSVIDFSIDFDAPLSSLFLTSPRLAASAAPAAFCCAFDLAGMIGYLHGMRSL